jgi:hypothetical protein
MNAKQIYTQAYSDRRAIKRNVESISGFLKTYNVTPRHTAISEKATQSYVNRNREQNVRQSLRRAIREKARKNS